MGTTPNTYILLNDTNSYTIRGTTPNSYVLNYTNSYTIRGTTLNSYILLNYTNSYTIRVYKRHSKVPSASFSGVGTSYLVLTDKTA